MGRHESKQDPPTKEERAALAQVITALTPLDEAMLGACDGFPGTDDGSHYMSSRQGLAPPSSAVE